MIDSLRNQESISLEDQLLIERFNVLRNNNLINKPPFHLEIDSSQIITAYLDEKEYEKIKQFDRQKLINEKKKVNIVFKGQVIRDDILDCYKIISTEKIRGKNILEKINFEFNKL
ncbi:hypothetical protein [Flammeovirga sp. MY04]|uniref:hypothetical protein n=1 Tax=Flammeovirga sp. MY04 TaxID=1191459 RepID=UPI0008060C72|nr:hypothetical protein [Flammeovirga sp. MY04]